MASPCVTLYVNSEAVVLRCYKITAVIKILGTFGKIADVELVKLENEGLKL